MRRDLPGSPQPNPAPGGALGLAWKSTLPFRTKADTESNCHKAGHRQLLEEGRAGTWRREHLARRGPGPLHRHIWHPRPCPEGFSFPFSRGPDILVNTSLP